MTFIREARLKPEFAHLYPNLPSGRWMPAAEVGAVILVAQLKADRPPILGERLLPEEHFEFRGGLSRGSETQIRSRFGEPQTPTQVRHDH